MKSISPLNLGLSESLLEISGITDNNGISPLDAVSDLSTALNSVKINNLDALLVAAESVMSGLTPTLSADSYTSIRYYDLVNGNDANNGAKTTQPIKTFPVTPVANCAHMILSGQTVALTSRIDPAANTYFGTWYKDGIDNGLATIDGSLNTSDVTRTIRVGAANVTIGNIRVTPPVGNGSSRMCVQATTGATGFRSIGATYDFPSTGFFGHHLAITANCDFTVEENEFINGHCALTINPEGSTLGSAIARVRKNKILLDPKIEAYTGECDGMTFSTSGASFDWNYQLVISENYISGFWENGIDLNDNRKVLVIKNELTNKDTPRSSVNIQSGMLLGSTNGNGGNNIVIGNYLHNIEGSGILARGGHHSLIMANIIDNMFAGININLSTAHYCKVLHNTVLNIKSGSGVQACMRISDNVTNCEIYNNIFHGDQFISGFGSAGAGFKHGGNLFVGAYQEFTMEDSTKMPIPPNTHVSQVSNALGGYKLRPEMLKNPVARLSINPVDFNLSGYAQVCQGAVQP